MTTPVPMTFWHCAAGTSLAVHSDGMTSGRCPRGDGESGRVASEMVTDSGGAFLVEQLRRMRWTPPCRSVGPEPAKLAIRRIRRPARGKYETNTLLGNVQHEQ